MAAHLAKASNCLALSVDYRRSPEHQFPAALDDCVAAYDWLLKQGFDAKNIITCGDSCGGGLSTTVPLAAIQKGLPSPAAAVSISPWYDMTGSGESMKTNAENDVLNTAPFVAALAKRYAPNESLKHELLSPIFADKERLAKLPPHWISAGGYDMLLDNAIRFADRLKEAGVEVVLQVHEGQQHVMEFMAGKAPEADQSIKDIGEWVNKKIGK